MKSIAALLFACFAGLVFYFTNDPMTTGDVIGTQLTPIALLTQGNLRLDKFVPQYQAQNNGQLPYFFHATPRGVVSTYPIAISLLANPIYAIPVLCHLDNTPEEWIALGQKMGKLSAAIFAALAIFVFWKTALALGATPQSSFWLAVAFAFGSELLTTGAQALWMHGPGILFLLLATFWSLRCQKIPHALLIGLACGIAVCIRPTNILFVAPLWLWLLMKKPSHALFAATPGALLALALVFYNETWFGQATGGYGMSFDSSWLDGLPGVLVSPASGLLVYFPVAIFGFWGLWRAIRDSRRSIYGVFAVFIVASIFLIAKWGMWHGGHCFGPRLLSEIQPFLLLGCIPIASFFTKRWLAVLWFFALIWCVTVQMIGLTLFRESRWTIHPSNIDLHHERLWDWRDNPVSRSLLVAYQKHRTPKPTRLRHWKAGYRVRETSLTLSRGETYQLKVKIKNSSREPWLRSFGYRSVYLSYRILDAEGNVHFTGINRGLLGQVVAPGQSVTVVLPVVLPEMSLPPGSYQLECSLMQENVASFAEKGVAPLRLPLIVP